jgi:hypothetical protein
VLVTDCVRTLRDRVRSHPRLADVRFLLSRSGADLPPDTDVPFQQGCILFAREHGDTISTIFLHDPNPEAGSIGLFGGWTENEAPKGAPNEGLQPLPMQLLQGALADVKIAYWLSNPIGGRRLMH